jgi:virulence factor Mce-like protein
VTRRLSTVAVIATAAVVVVAIGVLLTGGSSGYVVKALFADVDGLQTNFSVRIQGVVVGHVAGVSVTPQDTALVTLDLDNVAAPIGAGATASIHPSNLLGEKYVQIDRGDLDHPLPSGTTIPVTRTSVTTELDQVLDAFNPDTREAAAIFLAEQGNALLGRGQDLATLMSRLPPSLQASDQLLAGLGQDNRALGLLVEQSEQILREAAPQRAALGRLIASADGALGTLASREQALGQTVTNAPGAVEQLRTTLAQLQSAAGPIGTAAAGLRATAPSLTQTLDAVPAFARAAAPALRSVTRAAPSITQLAAQGTPPVAALRDTGTELVSFAKALGPVAGVVNTDIGLILDVIQGWSRAIGDRDGIGHIYRIEVLVPTNILTSLLGQGGITPSAARHGRGHTRAKRPAVTSPTAVTSTTPQTPAPRPAKNLPLPTVTLPKVTLPKVSLPSGGSSQSAAPITSLLKYLLGK